MTDQARIEEAHGLWELAVARVAALAEAGAARPLMARAVAEERAYFNAWAAISDEVTKPRRHP